MQRSSLIWLQQMNLVPNLAPEKWGWGVVEQSNELWSTGHKHFFWFKVDMLNNKLLLFQFFLLYFKKLYIMWQCFHFAKQYENVFT